MSNSKFCGLCSTTTVTATTYKPLRPRAVKLREAVQKLTDESQPRAKNPDFGTKPKPKNHHHHKPSQAYDDKTSNRRNSSDREKEEFSEQSSLQDRNKGDKKALQRKRSADFEWAREGQLSVILEILESEAGTRKNTPNWPEIEKAAEFPWEKGPVKIQTEEVWIGKGKGKSVAQATSTAINLPRSEKGSIDWGRGQTISEKAEFREFYTEKGAQKEKSYRGRIRGARPRRPSWDSRQRLPSWGKVKFLQDRELRLIKEGTRLLDVYEREEKERTGKMSRSPETPRPIQSPPRDLESISRIDSSLVFEHFTTEDAWLLGSALRNRLLPISTPVVINISLANQNQTLFHTCTHSGVMPDNDSWVARKRKTVLRWGCSTWYMHCKFGGDEVAFREKYGLGNSAGEYAIHGGGVPIRVTGVEGVVAVVVVSGLKQDEDHAVVVEVIRELYY